MEETVIAKNKCLMAIKHLKRSSISLIREMQIKITVTANLV